MSEPDAPPYDAVLLIAFGGPEGPQDVLPFLENVLRGRNVPRARMLAVAEHYAHFGGVSPINAQCRDLLAELVPELRRHGIHLPVYWGNRNWHPLLADTLQQMADDGVRRAIGLVLSAYSSYSGCRQYLENVADARDEVGAGAPTVDKLRAFYNHPDFIAASADRTRTALEKLPADRRSQTHLAFTAHSIPVSMSDGCDYVQQLTETCRLVAEAVGVDASRWQLVYQSRSGRPEDPWLEPDIRDHLTTLANSGVRDVVVAPVGFLSDHIEVLYDLDEEAAAVARELGLRMVRAGAVGTHPRFVTMIRKLIQERLSPTTVREAMGLYGPEEDVCRPDCCPSPRRPRG